MIERFNFYDVYGYLLPGVLLFSLAWIPMGVLTSIWPPAELSSAVLVLALAYVVGHILHSLSEAALPFEFKDMTKEKNKRVPSDLLLDNKKQVLVNSFIGLRDLADQIRRDFKLDVQEESDWSKELANLRAGVFFRCRNVLVRQKAAGYAEQQQGMYVLMRAAAAAFLLSCVLYAGMGIGLSIFLSGPCLKLVSVGLLVFLFLLMIANAIRGIMLQSRRFSGSRAKEKAARQRLFWLVAAAFFCSGFAISRPVEEFIAGATTLPPAFTQSERADTVKNVQKNQPEEEKNLVKHGERKRTIEQLLLTRQLRSHASAVVFCWAAICALLTLICFAAYRSFAVNYALTIYRDYTNVRFANSAQEDNVDRV